MSEKEPSSDSLEKRTGALLSAPASVNGVITDIIMTNAAKKVNAPMVLFVIFIRLPHCDVTVFDREYTVWPLLSIHLKIAFAESIPEISTSMICVEDDTGIGTASASALAGSSPNGPEDMNE